MKRYLLGFALTYLVSVAVFVGMLLIAVGNWLFSSSPVWFNVLCVIAVTLPFLAGGELTGRRMKQGMKSPGKGFLIVLAVMFLTGLAGGCLMGEVSLLLFPGAVIGAALEEMLRIHVEEFMTLLGQVFFAVVFHLGWRTGKGSL